ncbi:acetyltransferase, GNAT family [Aspergillus steynii IBT 23096]|uniref:Acetyltransferase, GNAT family n=1 Tax=Aspergillus steynii IBT 23096 TaxID=1392250 RepID=A0A2I2GMI4_9EURO|nr:acetyltransferase, GNAT family [Aspergillus steynii IBT 23096]PLB54074.1 acetyltransferase, GNAT family [Aspergillus steynii IBT 23096]
MSLLVKHITKADIPRVMNIMFSVMAPTGFGRTTGEVPNRDITFEDFISSPYSVNMARRIAEELNTDPTLHYLQAVDSRSGNMVALGKWHIYRGDQGLQAWRSSIRTDKSMQIPFGLNGAGYRCIMGKLFDKRKFFFGEGGREHCLFELLLTHPRHERQGAGSLITQWGCDQADQLGLDCYLESSDPGYPVYQRKGFKDMSKDPNQNVIEYTVDEFTGRQGFEEDKMRFTCMIRKPRGRGVPNRKKMFA